MLTKKKIAQLNPTIKKSGWVGEPIWLITGSIQVVWILSGRSQKLIRTKICKKISIQPNSNP